MKYSAYPVYKDSGVEWLGEIPEHWEVRRNKTLFNLFNGYAFKGEYFSKNAEDAPILVTPGNFLPEGGLYFTAENSTYYISDYPPEFQLLPGDQLIVMTDLSYKKLILGQCVTVDREGLLLNQRVAKIIISNAAKEKIYPLFLSYLLNASCVREQLISTARGATVFHSSPDKIGECLITLPLLAEQQAIASFLDCETAKLDALIAKKERLIELLQEKRTAIISHAVTKGLDPSVPLRDSGVEWLGEIPKHWEVRRNKALFRLFNGYAFKGEYFSKEEQDAPILITPGNFNPDGGLYFTEDNTTYYTGDYPSAFCLKPGEQLIVMTDLSYKKLILGQSVTVNREGLLLNQRVAKIILHKKIAEQIYPPFLSYALNSKCVREQVNSTARGSTVFHSSPEKIGESLMAMPPLAEQKKIREYLDRETAKINALIAKIREGIEKLKEYRTALISAAVTGKIDVRNEVAS
jgi:restriction endonuclease S subunit